MAFIQEIIFTLLTGIALFLFAKNLLKIRRNILIGKDISLIDQPAARWRNVLILAFGQKKMFRNPLVALLHLVVYVGFIIINIELLEIVVDGITGSHRIFAPFLGSLYSYLINSFEILALLVLIACIVFLSRRNILKLKRFISNDLNGWPRSDANYILIAEIVLMSLFLIMNAADPEANFLVSRFLKPLFNNLPESAISNIEHTAWWIHIIGIFAFMNYLPYSKHLHIFFAFPAAYYSSLESSGKMGAMSSVTHEVRLMLGQPVESQEAGASVKFGAKDVMDLTWKNALDAYSCTECGRCTEQCPANQTGRALSPRKIMMDTRDRLEEVAQVLKVNKGKWVADDTSLRDRISAEELRACTTCQACVEACPMELSPLSIILEMRRYQIMEESDAPAAWNSMFANIETNQAPWKFNPSDRLHWAKS